jgi:hypothetical protein
MLMEVGAVHNGGATSLLHSCVALVGVGIAQRLAPGELPAQRIAAWLQTPDS